jgi:hypothetical protein
MSIGRRRRAGLALALAVAAVIGAVAAAPALGIFLTDYQGTVKGDPTAMVGFNVRKSANGVRRVKAFFEDQVEYTCEGGASGRAGPLQMEDAAFRVKHGEFSGSSSFLTPAGDPRLTVKGKLRPHGVARGTLRLTGHLDEAAPSARCDTGKVEWRAEKNVLPPPPSP